MSAMRYGQGGSVLIIAVIAMLVLGILSFSFALLSRIEMTTGVNYKIQAQAESLAEAGLERGRDEVRPAASDLCGFTRWTDAGGSSGYGCGSGLAKLLFNAVGLGPGRLLGGHRQRLLPPGARGDPGSELHRGHPGPRHEPDRRPDGLGNIRERPGTRACARGPGRGQSLEARLLELQPGQSRPATATSRRTGTGTRPSSPRTRTSTRAGPAAYDVLPRRARLLWIDVRPCTANDCELPARSELQLSLARR